MSRTPAVHAERCAQLRSRKTLSCVTLNALIFLQVFRIFFCELRSHIPLCVSPSSWHWHCKGSRVSPAPQEGHRPQLHPPMGWDQLLAMPWWGQEPEQERDGREKILCWYQQLQDVVQRSDGFCKSLFWPERNTRMFSSSPAPVWSGEQQGYKHCLWRALGTPELVERGASAGTAQELWWKGGCISPGHRGSPWKTSTCPQS